MITEEDQIRSSVGKKLVDMDSFSITIPIDEPKKSLLDWIKRKPIELERTFKITPCKVGNMFRIASMALTLPSELAAGDWSQALLPLFKEHLPTIIYIVAAAIQNNKHDPENELIEFIKDNFTHKDLFECKKHALDKVGMDSFLNSIVLVRGTIQVLKPSASPLDGSELIASHIHQLD